MPYSINKFPFDLKRIEEWSKDDLVAYNDWFHFTKSQRIGELARYVQETHGSSDWKADLSRESLGPLGEWFLSKVTTRKRTEQELSEIRTASKVPVEPSLNELTDETFSLALDVGMYLGEVVLATLPKTKWAQPTKTKNFVDYGQPVIMGFGSTPLNPVRIVVALAHRTAEKSPARRSLLDVYDVWAKDYKQ